MRGPSAAVAINAAAYGLMTWHFLCAAAYLLTSSVVFAARVEPEVLVTAPGGLFMAYVSVQVGRRFAQVLDGDSFPLL